VLAEAETVRCAVVELDFDLKRESSIPLQHAALSMAAGRFVWIDLDTR